MNAFDTSSTICRVAASQPNHAIVPPSALRRHLLAGVALLAVAMTGSGYALQAHADELTKNGGVFGSSAAARAPATAAAVPGFTELVTAVKPAVVSVRVKANAAGQQVAEQDGSNSSDGRSLEKFFRQFRGQNGRGQSDAQLVMGQGSGFFISADGYIVTNNHVVDHAVRVEILTDAGTTHSARVIGTDPKSDLALIKVDGGNDFPFVKLAVAPAKIGEWVVAMGNPFGLGGTVTAGIVSAQGRDIGSGSYDDYIQIDAPVNRGNSGGPTFNLKGEVIGVNTAIYSPSGGSVGIAFDIPAATVASVIPQLLQGGHVTRGWLGVQIQPLTAEIAQSMGLKSATGALIAAPQPNSPAEKAGLKSGDVVVSVDADAVKDPRDIARKIAVGGPNRTIALGIIREGRQQSVKLKLGQLTEAKAPNIPTPREDNDD